MLLGDRPAKLVLPAGSAAAHADFRQGLEKTAEVAAVVEIKLAGGDMPSPVLPATAIDDVLSPAKTSRAVQRRINPARPSAFRHCVTEKEAPCPN